MSTVMMEGSILTPLIVQEDFTALSPRKLQILHVDE
jgi:hypothetical protein